MMLALVPGRGVDDVRQQQQRFDGFENLGAMKNRQRRDVPGDIEVHGELFRAALAHDALAELGSRSEEHTSELQSLAYLVCRLLLEKKKKIQEPLLYLLTLTKRINTHLSSHIPP